MATHRKLSKDFIQSVADVALKALRLAQSETTATNGVISVSNDDGTSTVIGGNSISEYVGDTTPPGKPTVYWMTGNGTIIGIWKGELEGGIPDDFDRVAFRIDGEEFGEVYGIGSTGSDELEVGTTYTCDAVAYDKAGNVSEPSDAVEITVRDAQQEFQEAYDLLSEALTEAQEKIDAAEAAADELRSQMTDISTTLTETASSLTALIEGAISTADEALEATTSLQLTIDGITTQVAELYTSSEETLERMSTLEQTVEGFTATITEAYEAADASLQETLTALIEATAAEIKSTLTTEYTNNEDLEAQLQSIIDQTSESISAAVEGVITTDTLADELTTYLSGAGADILVNLIQTYVDSLVYDEDGNEIYATTSQLTQTSNSLTTSITTVQSSVSSLSDDVDSLSDSVDSAVDDIEALEAVYGTSSSSATKTTKSVTCSNFTLTTGSRVTVKFSYANTYLGAIKLNVNSTGAKTIYVGTSATSTTNGLLWAAGAYITFIYNGSYWVVTETPGSYSCTCSIAAATAAKTAAPTQDAVIMNGTLVSVAFTYGNSADEPTFDLDSTGAYSIYVNGEAASEDNPLSLKSGVALSLQWTGSYWEVPETSVSSIIRQDSKGITISRYTGGDQDSSEAVLTNKSLTFANAAGKYYAKMGTDGFTVYDEGTQMGNFSSSGIYLGQGEVGSTEYNKLILTSGGVQVFIPQTTVSDGVYGFTISNTDLNPSYQEAYFRVNTQGDVGIGGNLYFGTSSKAQAAIHLATATWTTTTNWTENVLVDFSATLTEVEAYYPMGLIRCYIDSGTFQSYFYLHGWTNFATTTSMAPKGHIYYLPRESASSSHNLTLYVSWLCVRENLLGLGSDYASTSSAKAATLIDLEGLEEGEEEDEEEGEEEAANITVAECEVVDFTVL